MPAVLSTHRTDSSGGAQSEALSRAAACRVKCTLEMLGTNADRTHGCTNHGFGRNNLCVRDHGVDTPTHTHERATLARTMGVKRTLMSKCEFIV